MEPFTWKKNTPFAKVILPPYCISLCCQGMNYFSCLQCLQAQVEPLKNLRLALFHFTLKGEGSQSKVPIKD